VQGVLLPSTSACGSILPLISSLTSNRIPETLPTEVLTKMHAPPKPDYPIISANDLKDFDAFLFGVPTRYGNFPAQWKVRHYNSLTCILSFPSSLLIATLGVLGYDGSTLGFWSSGGQICRFLRLDWNSWRRTRSYSDQLSFHFDPSRDGIRPVGLFIDLWSAEQP